ncbi:MAG: hypothetical protein ACT4OM_09840 [Actinomycetota bacterium]
MSQPMAALRSSWQVHRSRPSILTLVIASSAILLLVNALIFDSFFTPARLAAQWAPAPLDLAGGLIGIDGPFLGLIILAVKVAVSGLVIGLILDELFDTRNYLRAGAVYLLGAALLLAILMLRALLAMLLSDVSLLPAAIPALEIFFRAMTLPIAILLMPRLLRQFTSLDGGSPYRSKTFWLLTLVSFVIWSSVEFLPFYLLPVALDYVLALVVLAVQSILYGAIVLDLSGRSEPAVNRPVSEPV